jgi:DNA repair exonuclease SbcCD ATPase subunit
MAKKTTAPAEQAAGALRLLELRAENFLRLKAVAIHPDRNYIEIKGANGSGKTSVLRALQALFAGKRAVPDEPVRYGTETATVYGDTGEYQIELEIAPNRETRLRVTGRDGVLKAGQTLLDRFREDRSFDPGDLMDMSDKEFADMLRSLAGIDTRMLEIEYAKIFAERAAAKRLADTLQAQAQGMPYHEEAPDEPVNLADLTERHRQARIIEAETLAIKRRMIEAEADMNRLSVVADGLLAAAQKSHAAYRAAEEPAQRAMEAADALIDPNIAALRAELNALIARIGTAEAQLAANDRQRAKAEAAKADLDRARHAAAAAGAAAAQAARTFEAAKGNAADFADKLRACPPSGLGDVEADMDAAAATNGMVADNEAWRARQADADKAKAQAKELTDRLKAIEQAKADALAGAEFPIDGLSMDGDTVRFQGAPRSQWSEAESLRVCFAVQAARHPQLAVAIFKRGAAFTAGGRETIRMLAEQYDMQAWLEVPSEDGGDGFVIADGTLTDSDTFTGESDADESRQDG